MVYLLVTYHYLRFIGEAPIPAARAATQQERRHEPQEQPVPAPRRSVPAPKRGSDDDGDEGRALLTLALKLQLLRVLVEHEAGMNISFSIS